MAVAQEYTGIDRNLTKIYSTTGLELVDTASFMVSPPDDNLVLREALKILLPYLLPADKRPYLSQTERRPYGRTPLETTIPMGRERWRYLVDLFMEDPIRGKRIFRSSTTLAAISDTASTHLALDRIYSGPDRISETSPEGYYLGELVLQNCITAVDSRNRLRLVERFVEQSILNKLKDRGQESVTVLSVAAGSTIGVLDVVGKLPLDLRKRVQVLTVDQNEKAILDTHIEAAKRGIKVSAHEGKFQMVNRYLDENSQVDIVEITGLLDYIENPQHIINYLNRLKKYLVPQADIFYANVDPGNPERGFIEEVVGWPNMAYRTTTNTARLSMDAGYNLVAVHKTPFDIFSVVTARNP